MRPWLAGAVMCLAVIPGSTAVAQVGHVAEASPYKDMRIKQALFVYGAYLSGGRGNAGVGPSGGSLAGARWEINVGAPTGLFLGLAAGNLERPLVNPDDPPETRFFGTANQVVVMLDGGVNFVLTGRKTWRGLAPYLGVGLGMVFGGSVPEDSSGFNFKSQFHIDPAVGLRFHPSSRIQFRIEARAVYWRLSHPERFIQDPLNAPGTSSLVDPVSQTLNDWTVHPTLVFGIGYTLRR